MSSGGEETELNFNFHDSDIGGLEKQVTSSHCGRTVDIPLDNDRSATQNLKKKEKELQAKEADLRRREQEVKRREDAAAQAGITIEVKNWPPLFLFISKGYTWIKGEANGDSHVPFRDSKLTMLLQDYFADDKSNILRILCASSDPKEMYKTLCTLEYGAKAKCIVCGSHIPSKDKNRGDESSSAVILGQEYSSNG